MSDKEVKQTSKKTLSSILKWSAIVLIVVMLEISAILTSVFVTESRQSKNMVQLQNIFDQVHQHSKQIADLHNLSNEISKNDQKIAENLGSINLLTENLNTLKAEVGNKRLDLLNQQLSTLAKRMETVEETKNEDALILSLALIIKENALYNRGFRDETIALKELSSNQPDIQQYVQEIDNLKETTIATDTQLIEQYKKLVADFSFEPIKVETKNANDENRSTVAKSIDLIKDTVSNINFDKVVVLKKDTKTNEQKLLLNTLTELVNAHNFTDAINFISQNQEFSNANNVALEQWKNKAEQKVMFDKAISQIITAELSEIRQNLNTIAVSANEE